MSNKIFTVIAWPPFGDPWPPIEAPQLEVLEPPLLHSDTKAILRRQNSGHYGLKDRNEGRNSGV